jgi:hypothetical protein
LCPLFWKVLKGIKNKQIFILDLGEKYCKLLKLTPLGAPVCHT